MNEVSSARRWSGLVWRLTGALMASFVVIAGLIIALIANTHASDAIHCVNASLGDRNGVQQADQRAHIDFARAVQRELPEFELDPAGAIAELRAVTNRYVATLVRDQTYRTNHPFGRCT